MLERTLRWTQRRLLWLLLSTYLLGAWIPGPGLRIRSTVLTSFTWFDGSTVALSLPMLLLGVLLIVAGIATDADDLKRLVHRPWFVLMGLLTNTLFPLLFALLVSLIFFWWHNFDELQSILVGLAMIGAMPIAGSSTAWSQNAEGNLALSLGLVLGSTLSSPFLTPLGLHAVGFLTKGDYAEDLHELALQGSAAFVIVAIVVPCLLGLLLRAALDRGLIIRILPTLKLFNLIDLLVLNYSNAAVALPDSLRHPDWDFLGLVVFITTLMCIGAFFAGWAIAKVLHGDEADQTAMMFGLGMNNNGAGLVLAASALSDHPLVLIPIVFYNLIQQTVAGAVDALCRRART